MSGYYPPPNQEIPQYYNVDPPAPSNPNYPKAPPMIGPDSSSHHGIPESPVFHGMPGSFVQYGDPQMQQAYIDQYGEIPGAEQAGNPRNRRRSAHGDHVKHRRTRSGCYTCRQRRVKCDEAHPICDRCRKGNRECLYPEPPSSSKSSREGSKSGQKSGTEGSSPEEQEDENSPGRLPAIPDDEDDGVEIEPRLDIKREALRETSDTPSLTLDRSPSPVTEASSTVPNHGGRSPLSRQSGNQATRPAISTAGLPQDVRFYLDYFRNHMSPHHYSLKRDGGNFFKSEFLSMAIKHEPLRYAVVGYAAYFYTLSNPDGRISDFLEYYNKSVSALRAAITKNRRQGLSTFLTILQLASIEEALGDWVNLMGHQKAAYEILTRLYTPETITQTVLLRKVLLWYIRFDLFVGFQSGGESVLGREWYVTLHDYYAIQARENPEDLTLKYEERFAYTRLVAKESSDLFARKGKGLLTDVQFMEELPRLAERVNNLESTIDPDLVDPSYYLTDFTGEPDPDSIVNPYEPNTLWGGSRWTSNYLYLDTYGILFMFQIQVALALRKPFDSDLPEKAYRVAQVFEAVCEYPNGPPGSIIEAQATLAIATLFLPKDQKTVQWCRRTFAKIEAAGYIYSNTLRNRMLDQWGLEHSDWWLPNDEACPRIIRSIKDFIHERTTEPKDQTSEDLREMKGIFSTLTISDSPTDDSMGSTPVEGVHGVPSNLDETLVYTAGSPDFDWNYEGKLPGGEAYGSDQSFGR